MPIYRSKWDPYDVDRRQPYDVIDYGNVRVRIWKNETWKGIVWKFDVVHVVPRERSDEISRGIPFSEARNAAHCLYNFVEWIDRQHCPKAVKKLTEVDLAFLNKSNRKR